MTPEELAAYIQEQVAKEQAWLQKEYSVLAVEIRDDTQGLGLLTDVDTENVDINEDNQKIADLLTDTSKGGGEIGRTEGISFDELKAHIDIKELAALSEAEQASLLSLYDDSLVDVASQTVQDQFKNLFGEGSKTEIAIKALKKRPASWAELLGYFNLKYWDVARARRTNIG